MFLSIRSINNVMKVIEEIPICVVASELPMFCEPVFGLSDVVDGGDSDGQRLA